MVNLLSQIDGLPFVVFISSKGGARHDARVKVAFKPPDFTASVSVRPEIDVVAGKLDNASLAVLTRWIRLNEDVIIQHWNDVLDVEQVRASLKHVDEAGKANE